MRLRSLVPPRAGAGERRPWEEGLNGGPDAAEQARVAATHTLRYTTQTTGHGGIVAAFLHEQIKQTPIGTRQAMPDASDKADRRPLLRVSWGRWGAPQARVVAMVTRRALGRVQAVHLLGAEAKEASAGHQPHAASRQAIHEGRELRRGRVESR